VIQIESDLFRALVAERFGAGGVFAAMPSLCFANADAIGDIEGNLTHGAESLYRGQKGAIPELD
jgi:hypothetical protein